MQSVNYDDIALAMANGNPETVLKTKSQWTSWMQDETTKVFFDYLIARRIELMQEVAEIAMDSNKEIRETNEKKGGYWEIGKIIEDINNLIGRNDDEEIN